MQWLRIGGTDHLVFFDRGANAHLVQGKMAVAAGFEITSSCHSLNFKCVNMILVFFIHDLNDNNATNLSCFILTPFQTVLSLNQYQL